MLQRLKFTIDLEATDEKQYSTVDRWSLRLVAIEMSVLSCMFFQVHRFHWIQYWSESVFPGGLCVSVQCFDSVRLIFKSFIRGCSIVPAGSRTPANPCIVPCGLRRAGTSCPTKLWSESLHTLNTLECRCDLVTTLTENDVADSLVRNINFLRRKLAAGFLSFIFYDFISRLDYCNSLLSGSSRKSLKTLQLVQNAAARVLTRTKKREHMYPCISFATLASG